MAIRSPFAETRNALCQAQYVPAIRSRHGSVVSSVSRTSVSQRSTSCSRSISVAWSSFSWMSTCGVIRIETLVVLEGQRYCVVERQLAALGVAALEVRAGYLPHPFLGLSAMA